MFTPVNPVAIHVKLFLQKPIKRMLKREAAMIDSSVSLSDRTLEIKKLIARLCEEKQVQVNFTSKRRESDLVTFTLHGHRDQVLTLPAKIEEHLQDEALELINTRQIELDFLLQLVITTGLDEQKSNTPERRAKLLHR